jgi:hypothetical protein
VDRNELIYLMTEIILGRAGDQLSSTMVGANAVLVVDGIRVE